MEFRRRSSQITGLSTPQESLGNSRKTSSFATSRRALTTPKEKKTGGTNKDKRNFDSHHGARGLPPLHSGDRVWVPERKSEAEVQEEVAPQSFTVNSEDGTFRRNRQHLIRLPSPERTSSVEPNETSQPNETCQPNETSAPPGVRRSNRTSRPPEQFDPSRSD